MAMMYPIQHLYYSQQSQAKIKRKNLEKHLKEKIRIQKNAQSSLLVRQMMQIAGTVRWQNPVFELEAVSESFFQFSEEIAPLTTSTFSVNQ